MHTYIYIYVYIYIYIYTDIHICLVAPRPSALSFLHPVRITIFSLTRLFPGVACPETFFDR